MEEFVDFYDNMNENKSKGTPSSDSKLSSDLCDLVDSIMESTSQKVVEEEAHARSQRPRKSEADIEDEIVNFIGRGLGDTGKSYWYSAKWEDDDGIVYEFLSDEAPTIEVKVKHAQ